ncbi:MAG: prepilin-type N-terminal cleavage/methylation domain-containing protein [Thermoleophilia bacterium]
MGSRMRGRARDRQAGFSYIEVLVGIIILAIVAGGIAQGLAQTSRSLGTSKLETTANKIAAAALERAHRMPYDDVGIVGGSPPGEIAATVNTVVGSVTYRTATEVDYVDDPALGQPQTYVNYKKVTVTVTPQAQLVRPVTVTTLVAPPAIGSIAGKSTIIATVIDAVTDQPLVGIPVTADLSTSPTQTRSTGNEGKVVFAGLEPSAIPVNDPKYKYRLTVGVSDPWVIHPDSAPAVAQQHLAASQTWTTTLKVFKRATVNVTLRDSATGQLITERSEVLVTTPGPNVVSESQSGTTGLFTFTTLGGKPIQPSASNFTVTAEADCYANATITRPVPTGYPNNTTEAFNFSLTRQPSGYLDVTIRSTAGGNPPIPGAQVQVSGGTLTAPRVRTANASGFVRFCLPPSGTASYVVSAAQPGYGAGSILATINQNQTTPLTMYLVPSSNTGTIRLNAGASNRLVRLQAISGTYDASQATNNFGRADFTGLAAGDYNAYIAVGFSGGNPTWSAGKVVQALGGQTVTYTVP